MPLRISASMTCAHRGSTASALARDARQDRHSAGERHQELTPFTGNLRRYMALRVLGQRGSRRRPGTLPGESNDGGHGQSISLLMSGLAVFLMERCAFYDLHRGRMSRGLRLVPAPSRLPARTAMTQPGGPLPPGRPAVPPAGPGWIGHLRRVRRVYVVRMAHPDGTTHTVTHKFPSRDWLATTIQILDNEPESPVRWSLLASAFILIGLAVGLYAAGLRYWTAVPLLVGLGLIAANRTRSSRSDGRDLNS